MESTPEFRLIEPIPHDLTVGIASTVQKLVELTAEAAQRASGDDPRALEDHIWNLWTAVFHIAARTARRPQKKLVTLISQLQKKSLSSPGSQEPLRHEDGAIWNDLPTLGWVARDKWNFDVRDPNAKREELEQWENKTAFLAALTALPVASETNHLDFSLYALWAFRAAFETSAGQDSAALRPACLWFIYAADRLALNVKQQRVFSGNSGAAGDKLSGKDWAGYNQERWAIWHQAIVEASPADDSSIKLVEEAKAAIEKAVAAS